MQHHRHLYADAVPRRLVQASDGLVERAFCLHDVIVRTCNVGIERYAEADVGVTERAKLPSGVRPCERPAVREYMEFRVRHRLLQLRNERKKMVAEERRLPARDSKVRRGGCDQEYEFQVAIGERCDISPVLRRLRAHEASAFGRQS